MTRLLFGVYDVAAKVLHPSSLEGAWQMTQAASSPVGAPTKCSRDTPKSLKLTTSKRTEETPISGLARYKGRYGEVDGVSNDEWLHGEEIFKVP